jgi:hypothetical protein
MGQMLRSASSTADADRCIAEQLPADGKVEGSCSLSLPETLWLASSDPPLFLKVARLGRSSPAQLSARRMLVS